MLPCLGLDPSLTNFGWALHDPNGVGPSRCLSRGRFQTSSKTLFIDRYCDMRDNVSKLLEDCRSQYGEIQVGVEYPVFKDLYSEGMYGLFLYTCEALREAKSDVIFFSPLQIKAHARLVLGRPDGWKMAKPDMVEAAKLDTSTKVSWNHNEADAYWVASVAARFWLLHDGLINIEDLTPLERKQFLDIHTFVRGKHAGQTVHTGILYREDERFFRWSQEEETDNATCQETRHRKTRTCK